MGAGQELTLLEEIDLISNPITDISALVNNTGFSVGDSITLTSTFLELDDCADLQTLIGRQVDVTHDVNCDTILVANFMNGNSTSLASRIYLWNPSASAGNVMVRVFTLERSGASTLLGTVDLGDIEATSARTINLADDILAPLGRRPHTDNGGNLTLEFTITAASVRGVAQVFEVAENFVLGRAFGTYPLRVIQ